MKRNSGKRIGTLFAALAMAASSLALFAACGDRDGNAASEEWQKFSSQEEFAAALRATVEAKNFYFHERLEGEDGSSATMFHEYDFEKGIFHEKAEFSDDYREQYVVRTDSGTENYSYSYQLDRWSVSTSTTPFPQGYYEFNEGIGQMLYARVFVVTEGGDEFTLAERYEDFTYSEDTHAYTGTLYYPVLIYDSESEKTSWIFTTYQMSLRFQDGKLKEWSFVETSNRETITATLTFTYGTANVVLPDEAKNPPKPEGQKFSTQEEFAAALQATGEAKNLIMVVTSEIENGESGWAIYELDFEKGICRAEVSINGKGHEEHFSVKDGEGTKWYHHVNGEWSVSQEQTAFPTKLSEMNSDVQYLFNRMYYVTEGGGLFTLSERYEAFTYSEETGFYEGTVYSFWGTEPTKYEMSLRFQDGKLNGWKEQASGGGRGRQVSVGFLYGTANPVLPAAAQAIS